MNSEQQRCGFVAVVGRPNVGKSTLVNHLLGTKLNITSRKPQTTRHNVLGIKTTGPYQLVFVDTPGLHSDQKKAINRYMNRSAVSAVADVDVVVMVIDRDRWTDADDSVLKTVKSTGLPVILAVNKIDRLESKKAVLPVLQALLDKIPGSEIIPLSALHNTNLDRLEAAIVARLPESEHHFPADQLTDRSERFLAAELVREKIIRQLGAEIPYEVTVEIEEFKIVKKVRHISALILVERPGQKKIIIGEGGERLKKIGQQARLDMEKLFDGKVMLNLWIKVRSGWSDDERALRSLGYHGPQ